MTRLLPLLFLPCLLVTLVVCAGPASTEPDWPTMEFKADLPTVTEMARANNEFGLDLFKELYDTTARRNVLVSPTSIAAALTMLWNGALGTTRDSLAEVLRITGFDTARVNTSVAALLADILSETDRVQLEVANSAWVDEGLKVYHEYERTLADYFDAEFFQQDLQHQNAVTAINRWVAKKTRGMIKKLIDRTPVGVVLCLLNAVYFDGKWTEVFDPKRTRPRTFLLGDGMKVEHPLMSRTGDYMVLGRPRFKAARIPYGSGRFAMYIFVPGMPEREHTEMVMNTMKGGATASEALDSIVRMMPTPGEELTSFIRELTQDSLQSWFGQFRENHLAVAIPRFRTEYADSLGRALVRLGIGNAFDPIAADFSGVGPGPLWVGLVQHKCVIEVDEAGTRAAAATAVAMKACIVQSFSADRPFFYVIRDDHTGTILFLGTLVDPRGSQS